MSQHKDNILTWKKNGKRIVQEGKEGDIKWYVAEKSKEMRTKKHYVGLAK